MRRVLWAGLLVLATGPVAAARGRAEQAEALIEAIRVGSREKVEALLDAGVSANARTRAGKTALFFATGGTIGWSSLTCWPRGEGRST